METLPAEGLLASSWLLIALPLAGAAVLLLGGRRTDRWGHLLGTATVVVAFVARPAVHVPAGRAATSERSRSTCSPSSRPATSTSAPGCSTTRSSAAFVLLITGVGSLIHIYSIGYMAHDPGRRRFFAYLNLFVAAMLLLVLGNNFLALYVGWEGVGLASYLLIAFWYTRPAAATAAKKAFIMNRVGDVGLALAIFLMFAQLGTTAYDGVFAEVGTLAGGTVTAIGLLLLLGACGKSGQFPLQAWLPDAMEGPTPVSALIHAATMVTAGVYLIARCAPIYDETPTARTAVLAVGAITLLIGAIAGCAFDDIKKVLAYSTVSQIGYMFLAVGLGPAGYVAGLAHLLRARLLQGRPLPRRRVGHARHERPGGHAPVRRALEEDADHLRHVRPRLPRADRHLPAGRLLDQGRDHRGGARSRRRLGLGTGRRGHPRRRPDRLLHDPADADDLLRPTAVGGGRAPARVAGGHDGADDRARGRVGRLRLPAGLALPAHRLDGAGVRRAGGARARHRAAHRRADRHPGRRSSASCSPGCSSAAARCR